MVIKDTNNIQERAKIYLSKKEDNDFIAYEYIGWIMVGAHNYRIDKGLGREAVITNHDDFTEYLKTVDLDSDFK